MSPAPQQDGGGYLPLLPLCPLPSSTRPKIPAQSVKVMHHHHLPPPPHPFVCLLSFLGWAHVRPLQARGWNDAVIPSQIREDVVRLAPPREIKLESRRDRLDRWVKQMQRSNPAGRVAAVGAAGHGVSTSVGVLGAPSLTTAFWEAKEDTLWALWSLKVLNMLR